MLAIKRREGESVVLVDGRGRRRTLTLTSWVPGTRYANFYLRDTSDHGAFTLSPGNRFCFGPTRGFGGTVTVINDDVPGRTSPSISLAFILPDDVRLIRAELLANRGIEGKGPVN